MTLESTTSKLPKIFIQSVPKAGAHFLMEIFANLGFRRSHLFYTAYWVDDYKSEIPIEELRKNPSQRRIRRPFGRTISLLQEGSVAAGHLPYWSGVIEPLRLAGVPCCPPYKTGG